jgi:hypothetical protein
MRVDRPASGLGLTGIAGRGRSIISDRSTAEKAAIRPEGYNPMLNFDGAWRYDSPGEIASGVIGDFFDLIGKMAAQVSLDYRQSVLEHFKQSFASSANETYWGSTNRRFAEGDLRNYMNKSARNAPLFIEAFYDACETLRNQFPAFANIVIPDVGRINRIFFENEVAYEIRPPDLICRNPQASVPVPVPAPSFHQQAQGVFQQSLDASERLLAEGHPRQAVQEMLWLLETITTAFRGLDIGDGTVRGKFFNKIVGDLKRHDRGNLKRVLEWIESLHGYLSSPTGGGVRHGADLSGDLVIQPNEARLFCNLIRSYITYLMAEHERLTSR